LGILCLIYGAVCINAAEIQKESTYPILDQRVVPVDTILPEKWTATAIAHPFSPKQTNFKNKDHPFTQISNVKLSYDFEQKSFQIYVEGCEYGKWLYKMQNDATYTLKDEKWERIDIGWTFPSRSWLGQNSTFVGRSALNYMNPDNKMDWWKKEHAGSAIWFWFDTKKSGTPFRMMFAKPPPAITKGDPTNLAFFQMFSFIYIVNLEAGFTDLAASKLLSENPIIDDTGLVCGNPDSFPVFNWTSHLTLTSFMTPVDVESNPLPTSVIYRWKYGHYNGSIYDRFQATTMSYKYNAKSPQLTTVAALFGGWPGTNQQSNGFLMSQNGNTSTTECNRLTAEGVVIGQQPPWWPQLGFAKIAAIIQKPESASPNWISPYTGSNHTVAILGVLFPPHPPQYPESTYLWTWYDYSEYLTGNGAARPITFMQSASTIGEGTSLALADYFDFQQLDEESQLEMSYMKSSIERYCKFKDTNKVNIGTNNLDPEHFSEIFTPSSSFYGKSTL